MFHTIILSTQKIVALSLVWSILQLFHLHTTAGLTLDTPCKLAPKLAHQQWRIPCGVGQGKGQCVATSGPAVSVQWNGNET